MARTRKSNASRTRENPEKVFTNNQFNPVTPKTEKQKRLLQAAKDFQIVTATGCAGTGKTHVLVGYAAQLLQQGKINKIIITRPYTTAVDESYGFLSGDITEKYSWVITPVKAILERCLGKSLVEYYIKTGVIEAVPLGFMRGRTFGGEDGDVCVIADEMQNSNPESAEMLLTRIGGNSKCFLTGDFEQSDIQGANGLEVLVKYCGWMPCFKTVEFSDDDIVRSHITSDVIKSFRKYRQDELHAGR